jgi:hypothetical protein
MMGVPRMSWLEWCGVFVPLVALVAMAVVIYLVVA